MRALLKFFIAIVLVFTFFGADVLFAKTREHYKKSKGKKSKIKAGPQIYKYKDHKAWKNKGRIVGTVRNCPDFKVELLQGFGMVAKKVFVKAKSGAYELEWLKPGKYTLRIRCDGYETLKIRSLRVKAGHDLCIALEFNAYGKPKPVVKPPVMPPVIRPASPPPEEVPPEAVPPEGLALVGALLTDGLGSDLV